ncbi:FadR family transcriptional regulator [Gracilibacillus oryzae]|uniref:FadR family transcriptional regulator n=1 Tax=Gracilibacillus oryzae TaxID=1672701 RepID=A0A7C8KPT3_9BACI|nr:FCD domain-containing protein [Gracilibacillus oryzae]KAB8126070.1 FadR family transcriptional regulator [Gracilibacillus oryzae]
MTELRDKKKKIKDKMLDIIIDCLSTGRSFPSENELTEILGISRPTLRELLIEFKASGIIVSAQGKGREVQLPNVSSSITDGWNILLKARPNTLLELLEVRLVLEKGFLPVVIQSLKLEDLQVMRDLVNRMEAKAIEEKVFKEEDHLFHRILYSRTDNILLDQLLAAFWDLFDDMSEFHRSSNLVEAAALHKRLYEAIVTQDLEKAEEFLDLHFKDIRSRLLGFMALEDK